MGGAQSPAVGAAPSQFQAPPNLPGHINFNAPVIRLGMSGNKPMAFGFDDRRGGNADGGGGNRGRLGLGADSRGDFGRQQRESTLQPLTKEEVARTIYVGGLVEGVPDDGAIERIMAVGGGLRHWQRVTDADGKPCTFGFAEFADSTSLAVATELFKEPLELPSTKYDKVVKTEDGVVEKNEIKVCFTHSLVLQSLSNISPGVC